MSGLPRPAFFTSAEAMPLVIEGGMVHCLLGNASAREKCFVAGGLRLRLCPLQSFDELEQEYQASYAAEIDAFKTDYLRRHVDDRLRASEQVQAQARDVLAFMVREMVPYLRSLQVGAQQAALEKAQWTRLAYAHAAPEPVSLPSAPPPCKLLEEAIGQDVLILDQYLYRLTALAGDAKVDEPWVRVNRRKLVPVWVTARALEQVEQAYLADLQTYLERQAQSEAGDRRRALIEMEGSMQDVCSYMEQHPIPPSGDCTLYDDGDFAILRRNNTWYVCQYIAAYVVEDADGSLYRFDATQVGLPVGSGAGGLSGAGAVLNPRRAVVLTPGYEHMFVPQDGPTICLVKGEDFYQALHQLPLPRAICELLQANTGVLRFGHNALNDNMPHRRINTFPQRRITQAQAEANHLSIIPYRR